MEAFININFKIIVILGILGLVLSICIWLLVRDLRTWYWKQNEIIKELRELNGSLRDIYTKLDKIDSKNQSNSNNVETEH